MSSIHRHFSDIIVIFLLGILEHSLLALSAMCLCILYPFLVVCKLNKEVIVAKSPTPTELAHETTYVATGIATMHKTDQSLDLLVRERHD